jgi:hypothetical protein
MTIEWKASVNERRWRVIRADSPNWAAAPWPDAIGIEAIDEHIAVPSIICWFTRGWNSERAAAETVRFHNKQIS